MLQDVVRIDVVWDTYMRDSLKAHTRMNRGSGKHLRVSNSTNIPVDWKSFIRCDANKDSLFHLLADAIREFHPPQPLIGEPDVPSLDSWGWKRVTDDATCTPCWTTLPQAAKSCQELLKCGCKKAYTKRCKCVKANLECTQLRFCSGQCSR